MDDQPPSSSAVFLINDDTVANNQTFSDVTSCDDSAADVCLTTLELDADLHHVATDIGTILHGMQTISAGGQLLIDVDDVNVLHDESFLASVPLAIVDELLDASPTIISDSVQIATEHESPQSSDPPASTNQPIICTVCNLQLKNQKNLRSHMQTHTGTKKFQCAQCSKSFLRSNQLKSHQKVHSGERPFECPVCHKTFSQSSNLLVHKRTHSSSDGTDGVAVAGPIDASTHQCTVCERRFAQQLYLKAHMRVHTERDPLRCQLCRRKYADAAALTEHQREHIGRNQFCCLVCGKQFERYINLKNHRFTHNGLKPHACRVCGKPFAHTTALAVHMRTHTGEKPYACPQCDDVRFTQWANYNRHMETVHRREKKRHECGVCGRVFDKSSSLKSHLRRHANETEGADGTAGQKSMMAVVRTTPTEPLHCEICGQHFKSLRQIRRHMQTSHSNGDTQDPHRPRLYECDECEMCADELTLDAHSRTDHPAYLRHACPHCPYDFVHVDLLLQHLQDHLGQKQCEHCGQMFRKIGLYKRHRCVRADHMREMRERDDEERKRLEARRALEGVNGNVEELRCDNDSDKDGDDDIPLIGLKVSMVHDKDTNSNEPQNTENYHDGMAKNQSPPLHSPKNPPDDKRTNRLRRHQCDQCARSFPRHSELTSHQRSHTGERPYQCEICSKCFTQSSALHTHRRTHTGERPYACRICAKRFKQTSACKRHESLHSGAKPHQCQHCGKAFATADGLQVHVRQHNRPERQKRPVSISVAAVRPQKQSISKLAVTNSKPEKELGTNGYYGDLPYPCDVCRKTFAKACTLWVHAKIHTGERNHRCDQCPKAFAQAANLKRHRRSHSGQRPHQCYDCAKWFAKRETLDAHMELHRQAKKEEETGK